MKKKICGELYHFEIREQKYLTVYLSSCAFKNSGTNAAEIQRKSRKWEMWMLHSTHELL
jgi:hypothetical protein